MARRHVQNERQVELVIRPMSNGAVPWQFRGQRDLRATTSCSNNLLLGADLSADRGPEQLAMFAVEPGHLHLLDRKIVRRTCVDLDAWQQQPEFEVLEIGRLPH